MLVIVDDRVTFYKLKCVYLFRVNYFRNFASIALRLRNSRRTMYCANKSFDDINVQKWYYKKEINIIESIYYAK